MPQVVCGAHWPDLWHSRVFDEQVCHRNPCAPGCAQRFVQRNQRRRRAVVECLRATLDQVLADSRPD